MLWLARTTMRAKKLDALQPVLRRLLKVRATFTLHTSPRSMIVDACAQPIGTIATDALADQVLFSTHTPEQEQQIYVANRSILL
jgi:hypothetical protein